MCAKNFRDIQRFWWTLLIAGLTLCSVGCASFGSKTGPDTMQNLTLNVTLDKSAYRPGEAMWATVTLANVSDKEQSGRTLNAASLEFWFHLAGDSETPIRREAVHSMLEPMDQMKVLAPGQSVQARFLLTRMTYFRGNMVAQVQYKPGIPFDVMKTNKIYSNVVEYEVSGATLFEREDAQGLIVKQAAIDLARSQCPSEDKVTHAQALLVEDEMGFYCYWVNLNVKNPQGEESLISYFINPYMGTVRSQAKPFNPKAADDPRLKRPGALPQIGIPTEQTRNDQ